MMGSSATSARRLSAELWIAATTGQGAAPEVVLTRSQFSTVPLSIVAGQVSVKSSEETETVAPSRAGRTMSIRRVVAVPSSAVTVRVTAVVPTVSGTARLFWPLSTAGLMPLLPSRSNWLPPRDALIDIAARGWTASAVSVASVTPYSTVTECAESVNDRVWSCCAAVSTRLLSSLFELSASSSVMATFCRLLYSKPTPRLPSGPSAT